MIDGMKESLQPALYVDYPQSYTLLSIRLHGQRMAETLSYIDKTWRSFVPSSAIQRYWLNDTFEGLFKPDEKQGVMFSLFVGIAIWISCLGLFGMAAFTAQRRTKEIGIRKVFGARTRDVVRLLLWQFSIPVLIANAVAWPIANYYQHHWLEGYAYRVSLNPFYFLATGAAALLIALITISAHALRVARSSPVVHCGMNRSASPRRPWGSRCTVAALVSLLVGCATSVPQALTPTLKPEAFSGQIIGGNQIWPLPIGGNHSVAQNYPSL